MYKHQVIARFYDNALPVEQRLVATVVLANSDSMEGAVRCLAHKAFMPRVDSIAKVTGVNDIHIAVEPLLVDRAPKAVRTDVVNVTGELDKNALTEAMWNAVRMNLNVTPTRQGAV